MITVIGCLAFAYLTKVRQQTCTNAVQKRLFYAAEDTVCHRCNSDGVGRASRDDCSGCVGSLLRMYPFLRFVSVFLPHYE